MQIKSVHLSRERDLSHGVKCVTNGKTGDALSADFSRYRVSDQTQNRREI
jgi:hypothetical protein